METAKNLENGKLDPLARILGGREPAEVKKEKGRVSSKEDSNGSTTKAKVAAPAAGLEEVSGENPLEAIRKAVFGDRIEALTAKFEALEVQVGEQHEETKKHVADGFAAFEKFVKRELKTTIDRLNEEAAERSRQMDAMKDNLEKQVREADERTGKQEKELKKAQEAMNEELERRAESLTKHIEDTGRHVYERAHNEVADLEAAAANRFALGDVLKEMGERMAKEKSKSEG